MKFFTCLVPLFWFSTFAFGNEERPPWAGFSGQAMVRLAEKTDGGFRVQVLRVNRVWKNNRASKPESLAGQSILVGFGRRRGPHDAAGLCENLGAGADFSFGIGSWRRKPVVCFGTQWGSTESARRALGSGRGDIRREERSSLVSGVLIAKPGRSGRSNAMSIGGNLR